MTVSPDARTPSADLHTLTGSTPPGAGRPVQPFGIATAPVAEMPDPFVPLGDAAAGVVAGLAALRPDPDAAVITLAARVLRLAETEERAHRRLNRIEARVDKATPPAPVRGNIGVRCHNEETYRENGDRVLSIVQPRGFHDADEASRTAHEVAIAEHARLELEIAGRFGLDRAGILARRVTRRLYHLGMRLASTEPRTQAGLKAKAEASVALNGDGILLGTWRTDLGRSVSRDALRIIAAEADALYRADQDRDGELLALGRAWRASCTRYERACADEDARDDAYSLIAPPRALIARPGDYEQTLCVAAKPDVGNPFGVHWYGTLDRIMALREMAQIGKPNARRDEIIAAHDRWTADVAAENERSGYTAARAERQAAADENAAMRKAICLLPARTPAGIDLKMAVILWLHDGLDNFAEEMTGEDVEEPQFSSGLALSLALDLARAGIGIAVPVAPAADLARVA